MSSFRCSLFACLLLVSYAGIAVVKAEESCDPAWKTTAEDFKRKYEEAVQSMDKLKAEIQTLQQDRQGQSDKAQAELQGCKAEKDQVTSSKQAELEAARHSADTCKTDLQQVRASLEKEKAAAAEAATCHSTLTEVRASLEKEKASAAEAATCHSTLAKVKSDLEGQAAKAATEAKSCSNLLAQVQTELDQQKSVATDAVSCKASLKTAQRDLAHHQSKLAEMSAKAEDMLLPPWLVRKVDAGVAQARQLYDAAAASEAAAAGLKYWEQAKEAAAPHVATVKEQWAKVSSSEGFGKVMQEVHKVEAELQLWLTTIMKTQPALAPYADPVVVQLLVYAIVASPFVLLLPLLALARGDSGNDADSASSNPSKGGKKALPEKRPGGKARSKRV